jgi:hypothetical protein
MDADSALDPDFLATAMARLAVGDVSAVGGTFTGQSGGGIVGDVPAQRVRPLRPGRRPAQGAGPRPDGTATVFRACVLTEVRQGPH